MKETEIAPYCIGKGWRRSVSLERMLQNAAMAMEVRREVPGAVTALRGKLGKFGT